MRRLGRSLRRLRGSAGNDEDGDESEDAHGERLQGCWFHGRRE